MNSYISQLKNRMAAAPVKGNYFSQLRQFKVVEPTAQEKPIPKQEVKEDDPDALIKKDILESKKEGFTLEDVLNAIDEMDDIKQKDHAKEVAKKIFSEQ